MDDAISPGGHNHSKENATMIEETIVMDTTLKLDMLPKSILIDRVTFSDNDIAYTNTKIPIKTITNKRKIAGKEIEYLVTSADSTQQWTPKSRPKEYKTFIEECENVVRSSQGLPPLRRSARPAKLDLAPDPPPEYYIRNPLHTPTYLHFDPTYQSSLEEKSHT
ncbi:hypothetical protein AC1031_007879, partial [Aphanomyces cochlioides]